MAGARFTRSHLSHRVNKAKRFSGYCAPQSKHILGVVDDGVKLLFFKKVYGALSLVVDPKGGANLHMLRKHYHDMASFPNK